MKLIMKLILPLLMVAFLIVGCDKTNNPAAPINVGQLQLVVTGPTQHTEFAGDTLSYRVFVMSADSSAAVDGTIVRWLPDTVSGKIPFLRQRMEYPPTITF